jgi:hypothetical protein
MRSADQKSMRTPARGDRGPAESALVPAAPPALVMTPAVPSVLMFMPGALQLGWFNALVAVSSQRRRARSPQWIDHTPGR